MTLEEDTMQDATGGDTLPAAEDLPPQDDAPFEATPATVAAEVDDGPTAPVAISPLAPRPLAPLAPPLPPRPPKLPVVAEAAPDGWRTANVALRPSGTTAYVEFTQDGKSHKVFVSAAALRQLLAIAVDDNREPASVWRCFSDIPLDRPVPSRALGEELRACLRAHSRARRSPEG